MIRFLTSGESHGRCLAAIIDGMPYGLKISEKDINLELSRRRKGYGRGERAASIENDIAEIVSGVRQGRTIASPITILIKNRDWQNWSEVMCLEKMKFDKRFIMPSARPGHADLAGYLKYDSEEIRDILERASARETAARVAVGSVCKKFLSEFGIRITSYVKEIGGIKARNVNIDIDKIISASEQSPVRCLDSAAEKNMIKMIEKAQADGNTLGGRFVVVVSGAPVGLGSHAQWDNKLDARLSLALMSIQSVKAVAIGAGFNASELSGSKFHDEIYYKKGIGYLRKTNNAGGIEGGISNGETIICDCIVKPIPSLKKPLTTVDLKTKKSVKAEAVRSDVCVVPAAGVVGESAVAVEIAKAFTEKFSGDTIREIKRNFSAYRAYLAKR
ncbi:MAG: Chorismate synthase [Elusimicrobia bacterium ADurb.Bin231]|nr:MAG: Chorismate synthase [Elusimicrobia bacterium ADurb.Bin231]